MANDAISAASSNAKKKVVILGGGGGGVSTAFWLSSTPELRERFDITLYSRGWRLGGKGASGRNAAAGERIEEHGLHVMMGCYQNVFHTMRECYGAWKPPADNRIKSWKDAFEPHNSVYMWDGSADDPWHFSFPEIPGEPGEIDGGGIHSLWLGLCRLLKSEVLKVGSWDHVNDAAEDVEKILKRVEKALVSVVYDFITLRPAGLFTDLQKLLPDLDDDDLFNGFEVALQRFWILLDIGVAVAKGLLEDVLLKMWFQKPSTSLAMLNEQDFRSWIRSHGASQRSVDAPPLTTIYELAFAYRNGDSEDPAQASMAAGVTLLFALQLVLDYRKAPIWRMNAGMGDIIFTPMYQVLKERGVDIRLFHTIDRVQTDAQGSGVETVHLARQADLVNGDYQPFRRVKNLDCWPSEPFWDQLVNGDQLRDMCVNFESVWDDTRVATFELQRGKDFDLVVLAVPPEMQKIIAPDLSAKSSSYDQMIKTSAFVRTRSTQIWLTEPMKKLASYGKLPLMGTLPAPYNTWADMSELLVSEDWPADNAPQTIAYICATMEAPLTVPPHPIKAAHLVAMQSAEDWIAANATAVWPKGDWTDFTLTPLPQIVQSAYFRGNVEPSELYVLTPSGDNVKSRFDPGNTPFDNLYLAGDWTRTRYSGGCFESTVESGMLASKAISGHPRKIQTS
jgi:uncharacterized protein with NAD-binding domain and iron-sulfur cluster